jgi:nondiscriminating glutamyl-tRNA synthetase
MAEKSARPVRTRFAPSPTGPLHIGGARTALFSWLFARKYGGTFVLRVEDTDRERSEKKYEEELIAGLSWLGLDWDEGPTEKGPYGPYRQTARTALYVKYLKVLLEKGDAYYCYCTKDELEGQRDAMVAQGLPPKYNGRCRNLTDPPAGKKPEVIRFKVPGMKVEFEDMVRGTVVFDTSLFGDIVIAKDPENPLYNFAVVVDDELMKISHVIRGEEHLSNTPKQILMQRALGFTPPTYAHIPLILNPDRTKMSKRFADTALLNYRDQGYLPEALTNFLALLGWHPKGDREVFSKEELIAEFDMERVQPSGAIFNQEKLDWINREYLKTFDDKKIVALLKPFLEKARLHGAPEFLEKWVAVERGRANTLNDFISLGGLFFALPEYDAELLIWKESSREEAAAALAAAQKCLTGLDARSFTKETLMDAIASVIGEKKRGAVLWPLRVALSGAKASPDPIDIMAVLGREESLKRIAAARGKLAV